MTIKDKAVDEEQVICFSVIEAEGEKAAQDAAWIKANELTDRFWENGRHSRVVVSEVRRFGLGSWLRPGVVCNRRHRGPDGRFPE